MIDNIPNADDSPRLLARPTPQGGAWVLNEAAYELGVAQRGIPAERMKMSKPHSVFLSRKAFVIRHQVREQVRHGDHVFPSIFLGSVLMGAVKLNHLFRRIDLGFQTSTHTGLAARR